MGRLERLALQLTVAAASLIPIGAGAAGILLGPRMVNAIITAPADLDSHYRYLSGLLLGVGLGFASTIPHIEMRGRRFRLLAGIVILGGAGRLMSLLSIGSPSPAMLAALVMELIVTPGLALWQYRVTIGARQ